MTERESIGDVYDISKYRIEAHRRRLRGIFDRSEWCLFLIRLLTPLQAARNVLAVSVQITWQHPGFAEQLKTAFYDIAERYGLGREEPSRIYVMTSHRTDQGCLLAISGEQTNPKWSPYELNYKVNTKEVIEMKNKSWMMLALLLSITVLLFTASCSKQTINADIKDVKDAAKREPAPVVAAPAPAPVVQNAPEPVGPSVEELAAKAKAAALKTLVNEDVFFDYDSAVLSAAAQDVLKNKSGNPREIFRSFSDDWRTL